VDNKSRTTLIQKLLQHTGSISGTLTVDSFAEIKSRDFYCAKSLEPVSSIPVQYYTLILYRLWSFDSDICFIHFTWA